MGAGPGAELRADLIRLIRADLTGVGLTGAGLTGADRMSGGLAWRLLLAASRAASCTVRAAYRY
ncbi:hypothetical protein D3C71_1372950 [compost metagenome]